MAMKSSPYVTIPLPSVNRQIPLTNQNSTLHSPEAKHPMALTRYAESEIPTRNGRFRVVVYRDCKDDSEHIAIVRGDVFGKDKVLCRVHSECWTSEVLGSL